MKKIILSVLFVSILLINMPVLAEAFYCRGYVESIAIEPSSGILQVNDGYGVHYLCSFNNVYNGIQPETCRVWYTLFLTAQVANKKIEQY